MMADDKQKSALVRRHEQLKRWADSDTSRASDAVKDKDRKVKFQDGCVFLAACSAGDTAEVRALLEKGGNPNTTNVDGLTALHQACIDDNIEMVKFLLDHGANINAQDNEGWTPLHATASCGYQDVARYLIDHGADISRTNSDGDLPIDIAEGEDMEVLLAREMEKQNVDADAARNDEENRMLVDANNWLQNKSIQEERHGRSGATALHVAAAKGYLKVMPILLQAGADINARDFDGWTPLHAAAHWGQEDACKVLAEHMCNMDARSNADLTVFDVADEELRKLLEDLKEKQQTIKNKEKKENLDDETVNASGKQHTPYRRRTSVNRINTEEKHNMVAHKAVEEGVILVTARDENHVGASNQDSEEDDELTEKKVLADAGGLAGKGQESTGTKTNDKLEKTWTTRRDESGRVIGNSTVAEDTAARSSLGITGGRNSALADGAQVPESRSEPARRGSTSFQENLSTATPAVGSTSSAVTGAAGSSSTGASGKATPRNVTLDKNADMVPPLDLSEAKEDEDQFIDDAFGSFNGVYGSSSSGGRHERLSRTGSLPSQLLERRGAISSGQSATRPSSSAAAAPGGGAAAPGLQRIDSAITPDSWRAGLRKTGSSGAVSDGAYTQRTGGGSTPAQAGSDAAVGAGDKIVQRSASSSVLLGGGSSSTAAPETSAANSAAGTLPSTQVATRQPRPSSYLSTLASSAVAASAADAADRRHSAMDRLSSSSSSTATTTTPSAYIPYYRRKQMERESKEKEERERLGLSAGESSDGSLALSTDATGAAEAGSSAQERRSSKFELPKRDEETETIRKMKAKQARATRRSTQGVTQEDVKAAEATLKSADKGAAAAASAVAAAAAFAETADSRLGSAAASKDPLPSPTAAVASTGSAAPTFVPKEPAAIVVADDDSRGEENPRRHPWQRDDPGRSSFRKAREVISSSASTPAATSTAAAAPDAGKLTSVVVSDDEKDKDDDDKSGNRRSALRPRRTRRERRSTGIPPDEAQEKKAEEKEGTVENTDDYKASSSRYDSRRTPSTSDVPASTTATAATPSNNTSSSLLQRGDRSSYRQYLRNATNATGLTDSPASSGVSSAIEDFKKLYEDTKQENEKLKKDLQKLEQDFAETRSELEKARSQRNDSRVIDSGLEKRERRALERRISELEEELKNAGTLKQENELLKQDNLRLKEENGALIRVISKLSK